MFIRIENLSGASITWQIMDQVRAQCASGILSPGDRLPSVRSLARELAVNQNTVLRAYERLSQEGILEMLHGDGTYVSSKLPKGHVRSQEQALRREALLLARRATTLGVSPDELKDILDEAFRTVEKGAQMERRQP